MGLTNTQRAGRATGIFVGRFARRGVSGVLLVSGILLLTFILGGCRAHPISLGAMLAGDAINDADVKERQGELMGKDEAAADRVLGERLETFDDIEYPAVRIIFYPVKNDLLKSSRYIVELEDGDIVVLSKMKVNIDGLEDNIHDANLEKKLLGKTPEQCSEDDDLGKPLRTLRDRKKNQLLRIYDIRHWSDFMGARYCVLRFDENDRCQDVTLMGVSATTHKDPIRRKTATPR